MRPALRTEWRSVVGTAVVLAGVTALVLALTAGVVRTLDAPDRYAATFGESADVSLEQFSGPPRTAEVAALPAVANAVSVTFVFGAVFEADADVPVNALLFAGSHRAFAAQIVSGRRPDPTVAGEFVATSAWLSETNAQIGDRFRVMTLTQEQADEHGFDVDEPAGPTLPAVLVGVVESPDELQDPSPLAVFPNTLLNAGDVGVASSVGLVELASGATIDELRTQLDGLRGAAFGVDRAQLIPAEVRSAVRAQGQGLAVVAAVVGVAAVAVMGQLLTRRARRPSAHRLVMRSLGLTSRQIVGEQIGSAVVPVAASSIAAGGVAFLASGTFPVGFVERIEPSPGLHFDPLVHVVGPVLLAGAYLAWVLAALAVGRRPDAARSVVPTVPLAGRLRPGPVATGVQFALSRDPRDSALRTPVVGLLMVLVVLVGALTFGASLNRFIDEPQRYGSNYDLATGMGGAIVPDDLRVLLEEDADISDVTLYRTQLASVGSVPLDVTGMEPIRGTLEPDVLAGRLARTSDEIVLGAVSARQVDVGIGDELSVTGEDGPVSFVVTGLAVVPGIEGGDGIGHGGVVTLEGLQRLAPGATLGTAVVRLRPGASGVAARIGEAAGVSIGPPDVPITVQNMERVQSTPYLVAGSLAALAVLSLGHQLITSARRQRHDLAVLRSLGADRRWVTGVLHCQATVFIAMVTIVAGPLGVAAGGVAYRAYIDRIGAQTDASVPYVMLAVGFVGLVVAGNLVAAVPSRRARRDVPGRVLAEA